MVNEKYFLSLVRCALRGEKPEIPPQGVDFVAIFNLARMHNVCELLSYSIDAIEGVPQNVTTAFKRAQSAGIAQQIHQEIELDALRNAFNEAQIDFLPLKGVHLKPLYPSPDMRGMCDIDILIRKEQLDKARALMLGTLGYDEDKIVNGEHDLGFQKPPFISIELHHAMTDKDTNKKAFKYYEDAWSLPKRLGDSYEWALSDEEFYVHHIEHLAKHYLYGGGGVRAFCDIYVFLKAKGELDFEHINRVLEKIELSKFEAHARALALKWLDNGEGDEASEIMEKYILHGGSFGLREDKDATTLARQEKKKQGKIGYLFRKMFLPYSIMKKAYPVLKKAPILLPFCWIHRLFDRIFGKKSNLKRQLEMTDNARAFREHFERVGLL